MNEKQTYEQHLADKLQHLPPPADARETWEQMRALLDKEMPRGGQGGTGPGGSGRRWIFFVVAILLIGAWVAREQFRSSSSPDQQTTASSTTKTNTAQQPDPSAGSAGSANNQPATAGDQPVPGEAGTPNGNTASAPVTAAAELSRTPANPASSAESPAGDHSGKKQSIVNNNNHSTPSDVINSTQGSFNNTTKTATAAKNSRKQNRSAITIGNNKTRPAPGNVTEEDPDNKNVGSSKHHGKTPGQQWGPIANQTNNTKDPLINGTQSGQTTAATDLAGAAVKGDYPYAQSIIGFSPQRVDKQYVLKSPLMAKYVPSPGSVPKPKPKAAKPRVEGSFAFGLSLPMTFPVADQKAMGYNANAGPNTVGDYIPMPHMQYHFNNKTFLQTEVQMRSPQYIRPVLLQMDKSYMPGGATIQHSIYARKLYYFNLPVSIYHSPLPNFYMGTGLQFSSLISGVALFEDKKLWQGTEQVVSERYEKFRKDKLSEKLNTTEMRLLVDVNYYWNKFTVGLRYNQALSNYVDFQLTNTSPFTYDKNKALQFYLRYNLWEDIKRKQHSSRSKSLLSLK